jgi:hypothetical protein
MKKTLQNFYKKYRKPIIITGCLVGTGVVVYLAKKYIVSSKIENVDLGGKNVITWTPTPGAISLDEVKTVLEFNKDSKLQYAIFREGPDPSKYVVIDTGTF